MTKKTTKKQLRDGVKAIFKIISGRKLSQELGYKYAAGVYNWKKKGIVPINHVPMIHEITGVPKHILRPDFFDAPDDTHKEKGSE